MKYQQVNHKTVFEYEFNKLEIWSYFSRILNKFWTFHQLAETVIISQSKEGLQGEVMIGVFDTTCYTLIGFFVLLMIFFIWMTIQIEKHQNLTTKNPSLFEVDQSFHIHKLKIMF